MTIQEEIGEGMQSILVERQPSLAQSYGDAGDSNICIGVVVRMLWEYLHSQGVVIKVDYYVNGTEVNCPNCHCAFLDTVEPLIKE